jgi:hypothetical protein
MREGEWKLVEYFGDAFDPSGQYRAGARVELFNLRTDPGETEDRSSAEPARAREMQGALRR